VGKNCAYLVPYRNRLGKTLFLKGKNLRSIGWLVLTLTYQADGVKKVLQGCNECGTL
jgi:hypothetical protein